jgi:hypothetical protein
MDVGGPAGRTANPHRESAPPGWTTETAPSG